MTAIINQQQQQSEKCYQETVDRHGNNVGKKCVSQSQRRQRICQSIADKRCAEIIVNVHHRPLAVGQNLTPNIQINERVTGVIIPVEGKATGNKKNFGDVKKGKEKRKADKEKGSFIE